LYISERKKEKKKSSKMMNNDKGFLWKLPVVKFSNYGKVGPGFGFGAGCGLGFGIGFLGGTLIFL
jgi:hypothetical protein